MFVKKEGFDSVSRRVLDLQTTSDLRNVQPQHPVSTVSSTMSFFQPQLHTRKSRAQKKAPKNSPKSTCGSLLPLARLDPHMTSLIFYVVWTDPEPGFIWGRRNSFEETWLLYNEWFITLLGTNISHQKSLLKMMFLFPRWDMLVPWRVVNEVILKMISFEWRRTPRHFLKPQELFIQKIWAFWHIGIFEPRNKPPYFPLYWLFNRDPGSL